MSKSIYDLELHETITVETTPIENNESSIRYRVTRVPGGWIYRNIIDKTPNSIFVAWDTDLSKKHAQDGRPLGNREL